MSYSKRELVQGALDELGFGAFEFDLDVDQFEKAIRRLDAMMAQWSVRGIHLGYPIPGSPGESSTADDTGLPDSAWEAIITNLAIRIASGFGKAASPETKTVARESFNTLLGRAALPAEMQYSQLPLGQGAKRIDAPFALESEDPLSTGPDGPLDFN